MQQQQRAKNNNWQWPLGTGLPELQECSSIVEYIILTSGNHETGMVNIYDIRLYDTTHGKIWPPGQEYEQQYLDNPKVRHALHAYHTLHHWSECSMPVWYALANDYMSEARHTLPHILANIRVLIYNGQFDLICNHLGTEEYLNAMKWPGQHEFIDAKRYTWAPNGVTAGYSKHAGPLTFLVVLGGSHMVPMDKPPQTLDMINRFMAGKKFNDSITLYDSQSPAVQSLIMDAPVVDGATIAYLTENGSGWSVLQISLLSFGAGALIATTAVKLAKRSQYESLP